MIKSARRMWRRLSKVSDIPSPVIFQAIMGSLVQHPSTFKNNELRHGLPYTSKSHLLVKEDSLWV